jgi:SAM-dependent methyltransferase
MNRLYTIKASTLKTQYKSLGTDISRLIGDIQEFELLEDENGLRIWSPPITGDSQFYQELAENNWWYYLRDKKEYDIALQYIGDEPVLEVGCGEGYFALKGNIPSYTGLELNEVAVNKAKSNGLNVILQDFQEYAAENPSTVSCVCSFQVLEHLLSPDLFFQSSYKVLKDNGLMITAVPAEDSFAGATTSNCLNAPPHHITRWTDNCLKNLPSKNGFECLDIIHIPVEKIHSKWFWLTLVDRAMSHERTNVGIKSKIKRKMLLALLDSAGILNVVPEEFFIPGHTVVSVHRKIPL